MKPPPFEYARPSTLEGVVRLLDEYNGEARILAGGQSLIPLLNFRLVRPEVLVDIAGVEGLGSLTVEDGTLRIGATVSQRTVEGSDLVERVCPLLTQALPQVGHLQNRIRGTVVGSLAHADPAAELLAVALALDAVMVARSAGRKRLIPARDFFLGPFTTALEPNELLTEVRFPTGSDRSVALLEVSPRSGDFALVGVAATMALGAGRTVRKATLALFGVAGVPIRLDEVEALLAGQPVTEAMIEEAGRMSTRMADNDLGDVHADAGYRARVAGELVRRALVEMSA